MGADGAGTAGLPPAGRRAAADPAISAFAASSRWPAAASGAAPSIQRAARRAQMVATEAARPPAAAGMVQHALERPEGAIAHHALKQPEGR